MVHFTAEKHGVTFTMSSGDMVFYNNLAVLHGRNAFEDSAGKSGKRHIMRLWIRNEELAWKTPEALKHFWHNIYGDSERRAHAHWQITPDDVDRGHFIGRKFTST